MRAGAVNDFGQIRLTRNEIIVNKNSFIPPVETRVQNLPRHSSCLASVLKSNMAPAGKKEKPMHSLYALPTSLIIILGTQNISSNLTGWQERPPAPSKRKLTNS
jgi:hypothetical protein